ncbi:MAG: hypothetical protein HYX68_07705 [Planctomycetes bacterium]|nr:hypothetical protein [Planctomycetota bacterium]
MRNAIPFIGLILTKNGPDSMWVVKLFSFIRENHAMRYYLIDRMMISGLFALALAASGSVERMAAQEKAGGPLRSSDQAALVQKAERIVQLTRQIQTDQQELRDAEARLNQPGSEHTRALVNLQEIEADYQITSRRMAQLKSAKKNQEVAELEKTLTKQKERIRLARDRFVLALSERQILRDQIATLHEKTRKEFEELIRTTGKSDVERVSSLQVSLELDAVQLQKVKAELTNSEPGYLKIHRAYRDVDSTLRQKLDELSTLKSRKKLKEALALQVDIDALKKESRAAREQMEQARDKASGRKIYPHQPGAQATDPADICPVACAPGW